MTMAIWKKETGEMVFFEPNDYYALVDLKTLRMMLVLEISSENDVNRLMDGKKKLLRRGVCGNFVAFIFILLDMLRQVPDLVSEK